VDEVNDAIFFEITVKCLERKDCLPVEVSGKERGKSVAGHEVIFNLCCKSRKYYYRVKSFYGKAKILVGP